ncbi:MAG: calcium/sodium antiporter [Chitinophagales bacterium]
MDLLLWSVIFIAALALLIKSSDYFIDSAEKFGLYLKLSPVVIGTLILAFGTSLPELITSSLSVLKNESEIVLGNVLGSNIANTCLIFGVILLMKKEKGSLKFLSFKADNWVVLAVTFLLVYLISDALLPAYESFVLLAGFVLYVLYSVWQSRAQELVDDVETVPEAFPINSLLILFASGAGIYFGADYTIQSVVKISDILGVGKDIIAITAVALGTSLPELVVSIVAAKKGSMELAIGNVLGSSIFNILGVTGISTLLGPVVVSENILYPAVPFLIGITVLSFLIIHFNKPHKFFGILFLLLYLLFNLDIIFTFSDKYFGQYF